MFESKGGGKSDYSPKYNEINLKEVIQQLTLKNFRNFSDATFSFEEKNFIHGKNGTGKTNILEALSIFETPIVDIDFSLLLQKQEKNLYVELILKDGKTLAISYD